MSRQVVIGGQEYNLVGPSAMHEPKALEEWDGDDDKLVEIVQRADDPLEVLGVDWVRNYVAYHRESRANPWLNRADKAYSTRLLKRLAATIVRGNDGRPTKGEDGEALPHQFTDRLVVEYGLDFDDVKRKHGAGKAYRWLHQALTDRNPQLVFSTHDAKRVIERWLGIKTLVNKVKDPKLRERLAYLE